VSETIQHRAPRQYWDRGEKLRVKRLYLISRLQPKEIADKLGRTNAQVSNLIYHEGWAKMRDAADERAEAEAMSGAVDAARELSASVAVQGPELAEVGFEHARAAEDPKGFADAMRGTKIAIDISRQALGMDAATASNSITIHFGSPVAAQREEKSVSAEPIQDSAETDLDFA
jgi:hypothetical protein